jgi:translocation and assembly module TamB
VNELAASRPALVLAGFGLIGLVSAGWIGADRLAERLYNERRPWLERIVSGAIGQPLELGPYAGLRPLGFAAGRSRFVPVPNNPSSVDAPAVELALDPLGSLLQRGLVLQIRVLRPSVELRRNARGAFWELPTQKPGREPPRVALRIQVPQPGRGVLHSLAGSIPFTLRGEADLPLWRREVDLRGTLSPQAGGQLPFQLQANWQQRSWRLQVQPQRLPLKPLVPLLPVGLHGQLVGRLDGLVEGQLQLQRRSGVGSCSGGLNVTAVRWRPQGLATPLTAQALPLQCSDRGLRLAPSALAWGDWRGRLQGVLALPKGTLQLQLQAREPRAGHQLQAQLRGPWQQPNLQLSAAWQGLRLAQRPAQPLRLESLMAIRSQPTFRVTVPRLQLRYGDSSLQASGALWPLVELRSGALQLGRELKPAWAPLLGEVPRLSAVLQQKGGWNRPQLQLDLRQQANPLLGNWLAQLRLQPQLVELQRFQSPLLEASGRLPLRAAARSGWSAGALQLQLDLRSYPLERLSALLGTRLRGQLDVWGTVQGPLAQLQPNLQLLVRDPGVGPLQLLESWRGVLEGSRAGGGNLALEALAPAQPGQLQAQLDPRWLPQAVNLQREGGSLRFAGDPRRYQWSAEAFPLAGLEFALGPSGRFQPLGGALSGKGQLDLQPLWITGEIRLDRPHLLGLYGRRLTASGSYRQGRYSAVGNWQGEQDDSVAMRLRGEQGGPLWARFEARRFGSQTLQEFWRSAQLWRSGPPRLAGSAADLQGLVIDTLGLSLNDQLQALEQAQLQVAAALARQRSSAERLDPRQLQGLMDADLTLTGPSIARLSLDLQASGHLWLRGADRDQALTAAPVQLTLRGPLGGATTFSVEHLPLALLALFTTVPDGLSGGLAASGRFALGDGRRRPELQLALALQDASLAGAPLRLERGDLALESNTITLDWSLRSDGAANSVDVKGTVPLQPTSDALELRVASRGDGLQFLSVLGGAGVQWQQGSVDLQLLVRGSLETPVANGFLRFRDGVLQVAGQTMRELEATVLFDFSELELQQLTARIGDKGQISGSGQLGLIEPLAQPKRRLALQVQQAPFKLPRMQAIASGEVEVAGSLRSPELSGELQLSRGSLNVQPGQLATEDEPTRPVTVRELVEAKWDFKQPLLVMGQQLESSASQDLRAAVPDLPFLRFNALRLRLGPDLKVGVPNVLNFNTGGVLTLRGALDPSLQVSGVVRLLNGRLSLFTTNFSLDPDAPNVAVFTPSLGLIPYVDIALRTRVSDTLVANETNRSNLYDWNVTAPANSIDQLRLVKVRVEASGPADRLADNIRLTSSPPLPQERLVALIGGNSLVGLAGGNAGAALATVLGQSLLSPVVGGLSDAFGQRLTFALYPTYFAPEEVVASENRSRRLPSQLVLGSEIGLDVTERFNFSLLAAPNRSDIPPQVTLRYQASDRVGVQTSIDTQGRWQSQLQLLFRF